MNRCMRHHHNDTTGTDHRCQLADGHTGPHADPELRTSTRSPRGVHSMQWDDDGAEVPHTEHVHTAPRLAEQPPAELRERVLDNIPITTEYANALLAGHHPIDRVDEATTIIDLARDRTRTNSLTDSQVNTVLSAAELLADEADQQRIRAEAAEAERDELDR